MKDGTGFSTRLTEAALAVVRRRTGLVFPEGRLAAFAAGLAKSMDRVNRTVETGEYLDRLEHDSMLLDDLVGEITVGETYFFREPQQLALIQDTILPSLARGRPNDQPVRIWSAGCATGEEPYSVAIAARERGLRHDVHIVATDISRTALARARRGLYGRWSLRGGEATPIAKYFAQSGGQFQLEQSVRGAVDFRYLNLAEDTYPSLATGIWGLDLIICRNVLIYFDAETIARVAAGLLESLGDNGWLLLGASDPVISDFVRCNVIVTDSGLAYRRKAAGTSETPTLGGLRVAAPPPILSMDPPFAPPAAAGAPRPTAGPVPPTSAPRSPEDDGEAIRTVRSLANRGELEAAGQACASGLDRHRTSAELTYLHAVLLAEAGRAREAAEAARRALYLDLDLIVAHLLLGRARIRLGDMAGAGRALLNAERLLDRMSPDEIVPASDGEPAGRLAEMVRVQLRLIHEPAA